MKAVKATIVEKTAVTPTEYIIRYSDGTFKFCRKSTFYEIADANDLDIEVV